MIFDFGKKKRASIPLTKGSSADPLDQESNFGKVSSYLFTDKGERENNEDNVGMYERKGSYCFAIADGLGGHGKGEVASDLAVRTCMEEFAKNKDGEGRLERSFILSNEAILKGQRDDRRAFDMKTTLVLLYIGDTLVRWGHVGDSRLYYFENRKLISRTLDHSVPQALVAAGEIKEREIRHHPDRNRLLKVLGMEWDVPKYELADPVPRKEKQQFLMVTDGFWELIDEKHMERTLRKSSSPADWVKSMQEIVLKNGRGTGMDNYSAIGIWIK